jgi:hypothetical protein
MVIPRPARLAPGPRITREQIIERARSWLRPSVPYSQSEFHSNKYGTYRTDCSGYVSMVWGLAGKPENRHGGLDTVGLAGISVVIARHELLAGDVLLIAQDVQRSCCPDRYAAAESKARSMLDEVSTPPAPPYIERFAFLNSEGHLFAKDDAYGSWLDFNGGGASKMTVGGDWTGAIGSGNFFAKQGLYGSWLTMTSGGQVTDIAIAGSRFAFVNTDGNLLGKDDPYGAWVTLVAGGVSKVILNGDWIGVIINGDFYAKQGLYGAWLQMTSGGQVTDIAIAGARFAFVNTDGNLFGKDDPYGAWLGLYGGGVTKVTLDADWIGALSNGNFYAKQGLYGTWYTMASGGGATAITINRDWYAMIANGNFYAKQGLYGSWLTMASGGQATGIGLATIS